MTEYRSEMGVGQLVEQWTLLDCRGAVGRTMDSVGLSAKRHGGTRTAGH